MDDLVCVQELIQNPIKSIGDCPFDVSAALE